MTDSAPGSNRRSILVRVAGVVGFLILIVFIAGWLIRFYITQPRQTIVLPPSIPAALNAAPPSSPAPRQAPRSAIPLNPTFTGTVIDAQTHEPIKEFTARIGFGTSMEPENFADPIHPFKNGSYALTSSARIEAKNYWYVRVAAHGYLPAISPPLTQSTTLDFQLIPSQDLQGLVLDADGVPVAGAQLAVSLPGLGVVISKGKFNSRAIQTVTDGSGRYQLSAQSGTFTIVAMSDTGYAEVNQDSLAKSEDIHLARWGRIRGKLLIGTKPGANERISVKYVRDLPPAAPRITQNLPTMTDALGEFSIDRFPPGPGEADHMVQVSGQPVLVAVAHQTFTVSAGETAIVQIGGIGRPVIGHAVLPPEIANLPDNSITAIVINTDSAIRRSYPLEAKEKGNFLIEDVIPGNYQIHLFVHRHQGGGQAATATADFTMLDIPGGVSDEPLIIPDIKVPG